MKVTLGVDLMNVVDCLTNLVSNQKSLKKAQSFVNVFHALY
jgi:hypothetical protein